MTIFGISSLISIIVHLTFSNFATYFSDHQNICGIEVILCGNVTIKLADYLFTYKIG